MTTITILTTYYERIEYLQRTIESIHSALKRKPQYDVRHCIYDDCSKQNIISSAQFEKYILPNYHIDIKRGTENNGLYLYWRTVTEAMSMCGECDTVIFWADDFIACENYFDKLFSIYNNDIILNDSLDYRYNGFQTPGLDGTFVLPYTWYKLLGNKILPIRAEIIEQAPEHLRGSHVWEQTTKRLLTIPEAQIWSPNYSLRKHIGEQRILNPFKTRDIKTVKWIDEAKKPKLQLIDFWRGDDAHREEKKVLLVVPGEIRKNIQTVSTYINLCRKYKRVDVLIDTNDTANAVFYIYITKWLGMKAFCIQGKTALIDNLFSNYDIVLSDFSYSKGDKTEQQNIVKQYTNTLNQIGNYRKVKPAHIHNNTLPIDWGKIRGKKFKKEYDILIINQAPDNWNGTRRKHGHIRQLALELIDKGRKVVQPDTGYNRLRDIPVVEGDNMDLIAQSKLVIGNNCWQTEFANVIGVRNITIFTAEDPAVWRDRGFHRFSLNIIPGRQAGCAPCETRGKLKEKCPKWICTQYDLSKIVNVAIEMLSGEFIKVKGDCIWQ